MQPESITVTETQNSVRLNAVAYDSKGRSYGKSYTFPVVNTDTLSHRNLREVPGWVKEAIIRRTGFDSFHHGEPPEMEEPEAVSEGIDVIA